MKGISTFKKENAGNDSTKDPKEISPSPSTLNFLYQFARCYYVERGLTTLPENELVLN